MDDRLTELEIKLGLTEHLVEELNRTVFRQQEQLDLMPFKVQEILLVSSLYDAFIMEEDGSLATRLIHEYHGLNLSKPPKITRAGSPGEALALLAGDGLLTLAFEVMAEQRNVKPSALVEFIHETAMCAGNFGMVGGQALDLEAEGRAISAKELKTLHEGKTGAIFIAAVRGGAHLAGATEEQLLALTRFAELVGLAFQIEDDILDVTSTQEELGKPIGSDAKNEKSTYVSLFGLEEARKMADETTEEALRCLDMFGEKADALRELAKLMCHRRS